MAISFFAFGAFFPPAKLQPGSITAISRMLRAVRSLVLIRLFENFDTDVAIPYVIAMILQTDVTFVFFAATVIQQFESQRQFILAELAVLKHLRPLGSPEVVFKDILAVLSVNDSSFIDHDLGFVPLIERFLILWFGGDQVVKRCRLTIAIDSQLCIGVIGIVKYLIFKSGEVDRLRIDLAILFALNLLCQVEDTGVAPFGNFPFQIQFEVLELMCKNQITTVVALSFTVTCAVELNCAMVDRPFSRDGLFAVAAPSVEGFTVKDNVIAIFVLREG